MWTDRTRSELTRWDRFSMLSGDQAAEIGVDSFTLGNYHPLDRPVLAPLSCPSGLVSMLWP